MTKAASQNPTSALHQSHKPKAETQRERDDIKEDIDDEHIWSPLQTAASQGESDQVLKLLTIDGADPNEPPKGYYGKTALQAASVGGHLSVVEILLSAGAEVD